MVLKVLAVGDVVGTPGLERIRRSLRFLKRKTEADLVIVNGENASGTGITPQQAEDILDAGADLITLGNHCFKRREIVSYLDDCPLILRPANYAPQTPGRGWTVLDTKCGSVAVINLIGRCGMDFGPDNPFLLVEKLLKEIDTKVVLVEFHAEATSEKLAMGYMLDGRISALWGTVYSDLHQESTAFCLLSTISRQLLQTGGFRMALRLGRQADRDSSVNAIPL